MQKQELMTELELLNLLYLLERSVRTHEYVVRTVGIRKRELPSRTPDRPTVRDITSKSVVQAEHSNISALC